MTTIDDAYDNLLRSIQFPMPSALFHSELLEMHLHETRIDSTSS